MKVRNVLPVLALGAVTASASAGFTGIMLEQKAEVPDANGNTQGLFVCNVYACFDGDADRLLSVGFASVRTQDGNEFYQHPFGTETAPLSFLLPGSPELANDTFVTIGRKVNDPADPNTYGSVTDPDYANLGNEIVGGWFNNSPPNGQGDAATYENGYVLIGQFTTFGDGAAGTGIEGELTVFWQEIGGPTVGEEVSFKHIPAPGALALLGVAGLAARRRRRA